MTDYRIKQGEFFAKESGDHVIKTTVPKEHLTDNMVSMAVHRANVPVGDSVRVQCVDKTQNPTELYWERSYKIIARNDFLKQTPQPDDSFRYADDHRIILKPCGDWWQGVAIETSAEMAFEWNVGRKGYEVKSGDRVVGFATDRQAAEAMAAGTAPLQGA